MSTSDLDGSTKPRGRTAGVVMLVLAALLLGGGVGWFSAGWLWPTTVDRGDGLRGLLPGEPVPGRLETGSGASADAVHGPAGQAGVRDAAPAGAEQVAPVPADAAERGGPRFDIVRVGPQGSTVIAGRAEPGAEVVVRDGDAELARTRADARGAFVALPSAPLAAGGRELTLTERTVEGKEIVGGGSVLLSVPAPNGGVTTAAAGAGGAPVALLVPEAGVPRVLQGAGESAGASRGAGVRGPTLDRVDYDAAGAIRFTGGAPAGSSVRVYVDNGAVGDVIADGDGRWRLVPRGVVGAGVHTVRVDALGADGRVVGRVEMPFQREASGAVAAAGQVVVQPGQSLWRLARAAYGRGVQYSVIYLANREQIRDPRLIYPGQTFAVPGGR